MTDHDEHENHDTHPATEQKNAKVEVPRYKELRPGDDEGTVALGNDGAAYDRKEAVGVDDGKVLPPRELIEQTGFGMQTLPYAPQLGEYGHHGTGMGSQSAQFAHMPPVTGPIGSGHPGREGTGMGSLSWKLADPNDVESGEIVAVVRDVHDFLWDVDDRVERFDHHSEEPIEPNASAMSGRNEYNEDGTIKLDGILADDGRHAHYASAAEVEAPVRKPADGRMDEDDAAKSRRLQNREMKGQSGEHLAMKGQGIESPAMRGQGLENRAVQDRVENPAVADQGAETPAMKGQGVDDHAAQGHGLDNHGVHAQGTDHAAQNHLTEGLAAQGHGVENHAAQEHGAGHHEDHVSETPCTSD